MSKKVGVVGLGAMGGIYVRHLMGAGFEVAGYDLMEDYVGALKKLGMEACQSPKEVAEASDVLITSLPSSHALESVVQGDKGVLESGKEALIIIDTCTLKVEDKLAIEGWVKKTNVSTSNLKRIRKSIKKFSKTN